jgi:hypothetical protein
MYRLSSSIEAFRIGSPGLGERFKDADEVLAEREPFAVLVDFVIVGGKAIFEAEVSISIFPHVDGEIPARLLGIANENGLPIGAIAAEKLRPDSI